MHSFETYNLLTLIRVLWPNSVFFLHKTTSTLFPITCVSQLSYLLFQTGEGLDNFWKVLLEGRNCSVPITKERFDLTSWYDPDDTKAGKSRTAKAALIDGYCL